LINVERGKVVDEAALLTALADGQVRTVALDCFLKSRCHQIRFPAAGGADFATSTYSRRDGALRTETSSTFLVYHIERLLRADPHCGTNSCDGGRRHSLSRSSPRRIQPF